jgi:RNA polymerase sigma-70 factor, ECF subfamily
VVLVAILRSALPSRVFADELEPTLVACVAHARATWPTVAVADERFIRAIAERLDDETALEALHTDDLYLACGCVDGDPQALAGFETSCSGTIDRAFAALGTTPSERADLRQVVRQRLLVAPAEGGSPRIATYAARGPLAAWVRVVATREAARLLPHARREVSAEDQELSRLIAPDDNPEVGYLKRLYRDEFKRAFEVAVAALADRDRLLLRQYTLDGLTIDQLAALHGVHRATTARWVDAAREALLVATQRNLIERLQLSRDELVSVMRMIRSQLDVSLPRLLG